MYEERAYVRRGTASSEMKKFNVGCKKMLQHVGGRTKLLNVGDRKIMKRVVGTVTGKEVENFSRFPGEMYTV